MRYSVIINSKEYEVEVERGRANIIKTGDISSPRQETESLEVPAASQTAPALKDGEPIKSPMPGTILEIKAGEGTMVQQGDVLLVLEAMKMENEIRAPRDGKVAIVVVSKGSPVATDDVLMILH